MKNKKGIVVDAIFLIVVVFMFAFMAVIGYLVMSKFNDSMQGDKQAPDLAKSMSQKFTSRYVALFDYGFLTLLVLLFVVTLVSGMMFETHPAFYVISFLLMVFLVIVMAVFGNTFYDFRNNSNIAPYASQFVIIPFVMDHFVAILVVLLMVISVVTYARMQN